MPGDSSEGKFDMSLARRCEPILALILLVAGTSALAGDCCDSPKLALFDGKTLAGWTVENDCQVAVEDGMLVLKAGDGWLRSHQQFGDFQMHVEWQALQAQNYDAGIFLRALPGGKPFPKQAYQVNLQQGREGNIANLPGASSSGLAKPAGEWNVFDISVVGDRVELVINGCLAYSASGIKIPRGHVGIQVEVPKGGQYRLRNVAITETGYRSLFNGRDFGPWVGVTAPAENSWRIENGELACLGGKGTWLRSCEQYSDFNLRFDYLVSEGGNGGIYVRVPPDGNHHRADNTLPPAGFEIQILDDAAPKHAQLKAYQYSGGLYDIAGVTSRVSRPAGEWNTMEINCRGQHVTTIHNGVQIVNATSEQFPKLALRQTCGYLGLQNHGSAVKFRNIRVGPAVEIPADSAK